MLSCNTAVVVVVGGGLEAGGALTQGVKLSESARKQIKESFWMLSPHNPSFDFPPTKGNSLYEKLY